MRRGVGEAPVTIVLPHRETFGPVGGGAVAMVVRRLATGGARYTVTVVGRSFAGERFGGVPFQAVRVPGWLPLSATQRYLVGVARVLAGMPVGPVEVHNKPDVALWLAWLFPRRPVSLFLHNDPRTMRGARSVAARRRLLRRLAQVVTVSEHVRSAFLDGLGDATGPVVLHNALEPLPPGLPAAERERVILFVGRMVADKGADLFVEACARAMPGLPGWRAEMIGADGFSADGPVTPFIRALRPRAAAAGVRLLGHRPPADVLAAMGRAAVVVVPSRWAEPFGLTALEAMACGAALVCSGRGGLAEVMGETGVRVEPEDTAGFAAALVRVAGDARLRAALGEAGVARAREVFGLAAAVARLDGMRDGIVATYRV